MRPRGPSRSSPRTWYVGQVAVQKPQCTHLRRIESASRPCGVSRMNSARLVCIRYIVATMNRLRWWLIFIAAAAVGFALIGFWGLAVGPVAVAAFFIWRRQRLAAELGTEESRLGQFVSPPAPE